MTEQRSPSPLLAAQHSSSLGTATNLNSVPCAAWAEQPLEDHEVCPSCGHYALFHDSFGCFRVGCAP